MGQLKLLRAEIAPSRVEPGSIVVKLDVLEHVRHGYLTVFVNEVVRWIMLRVGRILLGVVPHDRG